MVVYIVVNNNNIELACESPEMALSYLYHLSEISALKKLADDNNLSTVSREELIDMVGVEADKVVANAYYKAVELDGHEDSDILVDNFTKADIVKALDESRHSNR